MEAVCFIEAETHLPELLRDRKWGCPAAASLPTWLEAINSYPDSPAYSTLSLANPSVQSVLVLHRAAVERNSLPCSCLGEAMLESFRVIHLLGCKTSDSVLFYIDKALPDLDEFSLYMDQFRIWADTQLPELDKAMADIAAKKMELAAEEVAIQQKVKDVVTEYEGNWHASYGAKFIH